MCGFQPIAVAVVVVVVVVFVARYLCPLLSVFFCFLVFFAGGESLGNSASPPSARVCPLLSGSFCLFVFLFVCFLVCLFSCFHICLAVRVWACTDSSLPPPTTCPPVCPLLLSVGSVSRRRAAVRLSSRESSLTHASRVGWQIGKFSPSEERVVRRDYGGRRGEGGRSRWR